MLEQTYSGWKKEFCGVVEYKTPLSQWKNITGGSTDICILEPKVALAFIGLLSELICKEKSNECHYFDKYLT